MGWTAPDGIMSAKLEVSIRSSTKGPSMTKVSMIGLDLGKNAFQVHAIDARGNVVVRKQLRRGQIEKFFAGLEPVIVGMEACGGAHHWGRMLSKLGHEVRMMPPAYVKAYRKRNKTDGRDARSHLRCDGPADDAVHCGEEPREPGDCGRAQHPPAAGASAHDVGQWVAFGIGGVRHRRRAGSQGAAGTDAVAIRRQKSRTTRACRCSCWPNNGRCRTRRSANSTPRLFAPPRAMRKRAG